MRLSFGALVAVPVAAVATVAAAQSTPFPKGYEAAYRAYVAALPPAGRKFPWLSRLEGVASLPRPFKLAGTPVVYLFSCKEHNCDTDQTNVFLLPDHKQVRAVIKINGVQTLIGGAGPREVACVKKIDASGGAAEAC
jgi:hypothetical protein